MRIGDPFRHPAFLVDDTSTVEDFKEQIESWHDISFEEQLLLYYSQLLEDDKTLKSYGITENSKIQLIVQAAGAMQISYRYVNKQGYLRVHARDKIEEVKKEIARKEGIDAKSFRIQVSQTILNDYATVADSGIKANSEISWQLKLQQASVVVIGAGGLGCPALQYLAAAGIGRIGIVDHDTVEVSNLQRQILHNEGTVGMLKAESAAQALMRLNPKTKVDVITEALSPLNAVDILQNYDIILDCTDNAPTRYLISDTAVVLGKPVVSGAAERFIGQLCTYNLGEGGVCYRCVYPYPPRPGGTCEETGILGVVTGVIGTLQALETIKIITGLHDPEPHLIMFTALGSTPFRKIKRHPRDPHCLACGSEGQKIAKINDMDYVQFCGGQVPDWEKHGLEEGSPGNRIRAKEFNDILKGKPALSIIDVRPRTEYNICKLPESINIPLNDLLGDPSSYLPQDPTTETYVLCRLGNDSQIAAEALRGIARASSGSAGAVVKDIIGGLRAWSKEVDAQFPVY
ncbi:Urmylation protein [Serendipita sp. 399]|nr:Urmylation protein [Serendipita sp. 399]